MSLLVLLYSLWAERAVEFLSVCNEQDPKLTRKLISHSSSSWGEERPLETAVESKNLRFVAHESAQHDLTKQWMGQIKTRTSTTKV